MKKFRDLVWITDEDYAIITNIPTNRKMTDIELAAYRRASNLYWDNIARTNRALRWFGVVAYAISLVLVGLIIGYFIWS